MAKQRIEIEVDVPEGWEATGEFRPPINGEFWLSIDTRTVIYAGDSPLALRGYCTAPRPILRKVEPVRESRWRRVPCLTEPSDSTCYLHNTKKFGSECGCSVERIDYENGVPVSVTLEPAEGGES